MSNEICVIKYEIFQGQEIKNQQVKGFGFGCWGFFFFVGLVFFFPKAVMPRWESTACVWRAGFQEINPLLFGFNRIALQQ